MNNVKNKLAKALTVATLATTVVPAVAPAINVYASGADTPPAPVVTPAEDVFTASLAEGMAKQTIGKEVNLKDYRINVNYKGKAYPVTLGEATEVDGSKVYEVAVNGATDGIDKVVVKVAKTAVKEGKMTVTFKTGAVESGKKVELAYPTKVEEAVVTEDVTKAKEFIDNLKLVVENGKVYLETTAAPKGMTARVTVSKNGKTIKSPVDVAETGVKAEVDDVSSKKVDYTLVAVVNKGDTEVKRDKKVVNVDVTDSKPVVNYAYVIDGELVINASAKAGLASTPIYWKYSYQDKFKAIDPDFGYGKTFEKDSKTEKNNFDKLFGKEGYNKFKRYNPNDYKIPVEIPSKVQLVVIDALGNELPVVLDINKDNVALEGKNMGKVPAEVNRLLDNFTKGGDFEAVREKDMLMIKKDSTINLHEAFQAFFQGKWDSYNTRQLDWKSDQISSFNPYSVKFDKAGRYVFDVSKEGSDKTARVTVLVVEGANNIKSFKIVKDPTSMTDVFKPASAFEFTTRDGKAANPIGFYVKYDGEYYRLNDNIPFATKDKKNVDKAEVVVRDVLNNREHKITFTKKALEKMTIEKARAMFNDIKNHWAENKIVTLVANGVIAGYPDGTFKPDNKISIRETAAIIGRFSRTLDADKVNKVVNKDVQFKETTWGNSDVKFVLERLPKNIFDGADLDQAITRDQVAYIMNHVFKYGVGEATKLTDVAGTRYADEINALTMAGTIKGYPDGTFKPASPITRAELSSMMFVIPGVKYEVVAEKQQAPVVKDEAKDTKTKVNEKTDVSKLENLFK